MEPRIMESKALGDFTIIKQIGQGALGTVFLAEHRFMKKQFVLKKRQSVLLTLTAVTHAHAVDLSQQTTSTSI